jgi:hypothetical protein
VAEEEVEDIQIQVYQVEMEVLAVVQAEEVLCQQEVETHQAPRQVRAMMVD